MTFNVYSDSIGAGVGASTGNGFVQQIVNSGTPCSNHSVSGAMAADQVPIAKLGAPGDTLVYIGTNDAQWYGTDPVKREYFRKTLMALLVWNLTPVKTLANAGVMTGSWVADAYATGGMLSTSTNDTDTFTVSGTAVYVGMKFYSGAYGVADILVDGVVMQTISATNAGYATKNNAYPLDQDMCIRIGGLSAGSHQVQVKSKTVAGAPAVNYLQWCAGSDQTIRPRALISKIQHWSASAYASLPNSDVNIDAYNGIIAGVVSDLQADGHSVVLVDPALTLTDLSSDGIHPNDSGHTKIKTAFLNGINGTIVLPPPLAYTAAYVVTDGVNYFGSLTPASAPTNLKVLS